MILNSEDVQIARATVLNYESFCVALWLWNYASDLSLDEMKAISQRLKDQSIKKPMMKRVEESMTPKIPTPSDPKFKKIIEAVGDTIGKKLELSDDLIEKFDLK